VTAPTFDREQATAHLLALAPSGGTVFVGTVDRPRPFALVDQIDEALDHAASLVAADGDCYVTPALFERDDAGGLNRDLVHVRGAWVSWCDVDDWDDNRQRTYDELNAALRPGALFRLQSSTGRYHVYVRLNEEADAATAREMNERLVTAFDGDRIPAQPATWMRLAGTVHQPKAKDGADPLRKVPTAITFVEPPGEGAASLEQLLDVLNGLCAPPSGGEEDARRCLVGMSDGDGRNAAMAKLAGHVAVRCRNDRAAYDRALDDANALCSEPLSARELRSVADSIWAREHAKPATTGTKRPPPSTLLVRLVLDEFELWRDIETEAPVAVRKGSAIGRPFRGHAEALRADLAAAFFDRYRTVPSGTALTDAMKTLEGLAMRAPAVRFAIRIGEAEPGVLYLDLAQPQERFVRIDRDGWEVVDTSPIRFVRTNLTAPQETPVPGGSMAELRSCFPVADDTFPLLLGWLVAAHLPNLPHPVAYLAGERGTGKSSTGEHSTNLVDPVRVERRSAPSTEKDWAALVGAAWVTYMDNLSGIKMWFSDALCCAVTGGGAPYRRLYTDDELHVIKIKRPVMISGIDLGAIRDDLADRTLAIPHDVIPNEMRRSEKELRAEWDEALARNLGALLDQVSAVLRELPNVTLEQLPRMADFAQILGALDNLHDTHSVQTYLDQADELDQRVLESEPVATAVMELMDDRKTPWKGTATELLKHLGYLPNVNTKHRWWPTDGTRLGQRLTRVTPLLRKTGIDVTRGKSNGHRILVIRNIKT
jgi:hypothetical protein